MISIRLAIIIDAVMSLVTSKPLKLGISKVNRFFLNIILLLYKNNKLYMSNCRKYGCENGIQPSASPESVSYKKTVDECQDKPCCA